MPKKWTRTKVFLGVTSASYIVLSLAQISGFVQEGGIKWDVYYNITVGGAYMLFMHWTYYRD